MGGGGVARAQQGNAVVDDGSCRSGVMIYRAVGTAVLGLAQHNDGLRWAVVSVKVMDQKKSRG